MENWTEERMTEEVGRLFQDEHDAKVALERATQERLAESVKRLGACKLVDGLGQKLGSVDESSYHYWGQRLGYSCWKDKRFVREYFKENPAGVPETVLATKIIVPDSAKFERKEGLAA
ncbi:MAG: hypothetical protein AAF555_05695 [Verrucomicrobiota bacterium]